MSTIDDPAVGEQKTDEQKIVARVGVRRARPRFSLGPATTVWRPRPVIVVVILFVLTLLTICLSVTTGAFQISLIDVIKSIFGGGTELQRFFIREQRLPRAVSGALVGAALGLAGALVQTIARNPLASPDILGVNAGAGLFAVLALSGSAGFSVSMSDGARLTWVALAGGLGTGLIVYLLAWRRGIDGFRLVLIGIAITSLMQSLTQWVIATVDIRQAETAQVWLVGSLANTTWEKVWPTLIGLIGLGAVVAVAARALGPLNLGDDAAAGLGVRLNLSRSVLLISAVLLVGVATAAAGPVAFVAFLAPQVAVRLVRMPTPPLTASMLTGATLLVGSDWLAHVVLPFELPVGVVTAMLGGPFLVYLLAQQNRRVTV